MPRIEPFSTEKVDEAVAATFAEIEGAFGMVPNLFRTYAYNPALLEANWNKVKALMMGGVLDRKVKEAIAVLVSKDNSCAYCVAAHTMALRSIGVSEEEIAALEDDLQKAGFSSKEEALMQFARRANLAPRDITDVEFQAVRDLGATDAEIVEALGVMELFTGFNKFLDTLQVDLDF
ncbi:MAG TPA: peroxidase-related enzyme [Thermoleophilia bacterium]|nr:peroxidase-related enzyme [Thermoleophilia bacterium]